MSNTMLQSLSTLDVQDIANRYMELKHRLLDHAEDFEKVQVAETALNAVERWGKIKRGATATKVTASKSQDPTALLREQLHQQDTKLDGALSKIVETNAKLESTNSKLDALIEAVNALGREIHT